MDQLALLLYLGDWAVQEYSAGRKGNLSVWGTVLFSEDICRSWSKNADFLRRYLAKIPLNRITPKMLHRLRLEDGQTAKEIKIKKLKGAQIPKILKILRH